MSAANQKQELGNQDRFPWTRRKRGANEKWKTARLFIINSAEFWSWEARGKCIDVGGGGGNAN